MKELRVIGHTANIAEAVATGCEIGKDTQIFISLKL